MGWRLWRRKSPIPGVSLGLSPAGPSLRFGVRGAGLTVGGRYGLRTTVGIPGTGVYYTAVPRRGLRLAPPLLGSYRGSGSQRSIAIGCLVALGIIAAVSAVVATQGIILIPLGSLLDGGRAKSTTATT